MKRIPIHQKAIALLLCLMMTVAVGGCSDQNAPKTQSSSQADLQSYSPATKRKIIIDTDAGADDASALILYDA